MNSSLIDFAFYKNLYDNVVHPQQESWSWMTDFLTTHKMHFEKDDAPLIGFQSWKPLIEYRDFMDDEVVVSEDGENFIRRVRENVVAMSCLAIDYDDNWTIKRALNHFKGIEFVLYTSHSHQSKGIDRFRMVFPLVTPLPAALMENPSNIYEDQTTVYPFLHSFFADTGDESWSNIGRIVFVPSAPPCRYQLTEAHHSKGEFIDWRDMPLSQGTIKVKRPLTRMEKMRRMKTHNGRKEVQWESFNLERACEAAGIVVGHHGKWIDIECPWSYLHNNQTKRNHSSIAFNGDHWVFKCQHQSHGNKTAKDLKHHLKDSIGGGQWKNMVRFYDE